MAVVIPGTTVRTPNAGFIAIQTAGARELGAALLRAANRAGKDATKPLTAAAVKAMGPVMERYKQNITNVTGNLKKSVRIKQGKKKYDGLGIAVGGPIHVVDSKEWDVEKKGAGNHAFLAEFGTGPRRPGTQGRRTYLNVHQTINGRMNRVPNRGRAFDNKDFERMGRGFYFLMSSFKEPTRQAKKGSGYPHDFLPDGQGGIRPYAIAPGETYGAMPARHWMQKAIQQAGPAALSTLMAALRAEVEKIARAA